MKITTEKNVIFRTEYGDNLLSDESKNIYALINNEKAWKFVNKFIVFKTEIV